MLLGVSGLIIIIIISSKYTLFTLLVQANSELCLDPTLIVTGHGVFLQAACMCVRKPCAMCHPEVAAIISHTRATKDRCAPGVSKAAVCRMAVFSHRSLSIARQGQAGPLYTVGDVRARRGAVPHHITAGV